MSQDLTPGPISIVGRAPAQSTATWTSATALNTALTYTGLAPYGAVTVGVTVPSTLTAGAVTIEASLDGTNWVPAGAVRVDNSWAENTVTLAYFLGTGGTRQYLVSLDALAQLRVRLSTVITGTGNTTIIIAPAQQGVEPLVTTRGRRVPRYVANYRTTARDYRLAFTMSANSRKQYATIHHAATATKLVRLRSVRVLPIFVQTAASTLNFELIRITSAPATGNPAIVPPPLDSSVAAAETTCLALPTTAGTESGLPVGIHYVASGISGAASTANPPPEFPWTELIPPTDDEGDLPTIRPGVLEGWTVTVDGTGASTVYCMIQITFTEEPA